MGVRGIVVLVLCLALAAGCADPAPGTGSAPHGDAAPPCGTATLTDGGHRRLARRRRRVPGRGVGSVRGGGSLLSDHAGAGNADLAHPDGRWTLDAGVGGTPPPGQPAGSECGVRAPNQSFGLGPLNGDVGGVLRIQQGWQPPRQMLAGPCVQVPIPGTSWSLIYLAWHQRKPSLTEVAWVLRDLAVNWSQPPPAQPPSAYVAR